MIPEAKAEIGPPTRPDRRGCLPGLVARLLRTPDNSKSARREKALESADEFLERYKICDRLNLSFEQSEYLAHRLGALIIRSVPMIQNARRWIEKANLPANHLISKKLHRAESHLRKCAWPLSKEAEKIKRTAIRGARKAIRPQLREEFELVISATSQFAAIYYLSENRRNEAVEEILGELAPKLPVQPQPKL
jgi:hypothetical protein